MHINKNCVQELQAKVSPFYGYLQENHKSVGHYSTFN